MKTKHIVLTFVLFLLVYAFFAYTIGKEILSNWKQIKEDSDQLVIAVASVIVSGVVLITLIWLFVNQLKIQKELELP